MPGIEPAGGRSAVVWVLVVVALLVFAPAASATKYFDSFFGGTGSGATATGGLFNAPRDIAVNQPSSPAQPQDGWVYVVDASNNRIQAFNADKEFQWAIGRDVIKASPTGGSTDLGNVFEKCAVAIDCKAGATGSLGGEFNVAQGIDIDQATGHFFVRERNSNARVQEFAADGSFVRAFGRDVVQPGGTGEVVENLNERQTVSLISSFDFVSPPTGGTFTLTFSGQTTAAIAYNATPAAVDTALEALPNVGSGNVAVTGADGGPWTIEFIGALAGTNVAEMTGDGSALTGPSFVSPATATQGGPTPGFETCTVASQCKAGTTGNLNGQFGSSSTADTTGIAVAPVGSAVAGHVFVIDPTNRRVQEFDVPANPSAAVTFVDKFGDSTMFGSNLPRHVAVDTFGNAYAANFSGSSSSGIVTMHRYDAVTNGFKSPILGGDDPDAVLGSSGVNGLEIDHATGHLFAGRNPSVPASVGILELDLSANPTNVNASHLVGLSAGGLGLTANGIAVGSASGELLVTTTSTIPNTGTGSRVLVFDDTGVDPAPTVVLQPAEDVECTSATLRADINPNGPTGFLTSYRFEVSKTGLPNDWTPVGTEQPVGDGGAFVPVEQPVTGLEANTPLYRFRVRTIRSPGQPAVISAPQIFATAPCPPDVETIAAQNVTDVSAQLVGRLNPSGLTTIYWFEWGDTDYGNTTPAPAATATGSTARIVTEVLSSVEADTAYHFRLCAQNALTPTAVCGDDRTFTTEEPAGSSPAGRAYEIVSSPDKVLRRGGNHGHGVDYGGYADGLPAVGGDALLWSIFAGVTDPNAGAGTSLEESPEVRRRRADGWYGQALANVSPPQGISAPQFEPSGHSADLRTHFVGSNPSLFPTGATSGIRVIDDNGGPLSAGWYPFSDDTDTSGYISEAKVADDGQQVLGYSNVTTQMYRGVVPLDDTLAPNQLTPPQSAGEALFLAGPPTWKAGDLVNECTGPLSGDVTQIVERDDAGTPGVPGDDVLGDRGCGEGSPTDVRGASVGPGKGLRLFGSTSNLMSSDGRRVFFMSPSINVTDGGTNTGQKACLAATGAATTCPPQLFVRQFDDDGNPTVRWLSRAEDALFEAPQSIDAVGNGVGFEGASSDGSVVYFRANAPLTTDDPNGGDPATGAASKNSWDLYRYELGPDTNVDPGAGDPGDRLTRVTAGPDADNSPADPNTNCAAVATSGDDAGDCSGDIGSGSPNGAGSVVRFMSDDGSRVYFVTAAQIPGASNARPVGGATDPTGTGTQVNAATRNLYLYDADKPGAAGYEFIAQIPFAVGNGIEACLSNGGLDVGPVRSTQTDGRTTAALNLPDVRRKCVHGSSSGDAIVFESAARLTADDVDTATDVFVYDAVRDRLSRLSAPQASQLPYVCETDLSSPPVPVASCNGDLGMSRNGIGCALCKGYNVGSEGLRGWNVGEDEAGQLESVFFESRLQFTENAADNDRMKVYQWSRDGSRMSLVSPPDSSESAFYTGNGRSGGDVFFWTEQRLSGWEVDDADGDIYNATTRPDPVPEPGPPPQVCLVLGGGCHGSGAGGLSVSSRTSQGGGGNAALGDRSTLSIAPLTAKARRRAARTGLIALRVQTDRTGRVRATAWARIARHRQLVARGSKRASAGTTSLQLRLNSQARRVLRRGGRLTLTVRVEMPDVRPRTISVLLKGARS